MKQEHADLITEAADMIGIELESRSYGGRGMYGDETVGIVGDMGDLLACACQAVADLVEEREMHSANGNDERLDELVDVDDFIADMTKVRIDSMGLSTIIY